MRNVFLALLVVAVAVPAMGQDDAGPPPPHPQRIVARFLQLSPDQVTQWDALLDARRAAVEPLRAELEDAEAQLKELLEGEGPDPTAVGVLVIQGKGLKEQIGDANHAYVQGFEALLTQEQGDRLGFVRRADAAQPLFPAFRLFGLLPPGGPPGPGQPPSD